MSLCVPVVASDTGGAAGERAEGGQQEFWLRPNSSDELVEALERLVRDPDLRGRMGDAGRREVVARHLLSDTVEQYVELFLTKQWKA